MFLKKKIIRHTAYSVNYYDDKEKYYGDLDALTYLPTSFTHLFILSDEEIEDNDWSFAIAEAYPTGLPPLLKCDKRIGDKMQIPTGWQRIIKMPATGIEMMKIIATTNKSLNLPLIPNYFVKKYFESIDKQNEKILFNGAFVSDVNVEFENCLCKLTFDNKIIVELI